MVGLGSFIGGVLRYLMTMVSLQRFDTPFPVGTLAVNVIGCFLIGLLYGFVEKVGIPSEWRIFIAIGVLGGFTTFSAFSLQTMGLLRSGLYSFAIAYVLASVVLGVLATFGGFFIVKS